MKQKGFHLIEVLTILSIIGILLGFAIPHYNEHLVHMRRLAAETALMKLAGHLEAFFAENNSYEGADFNKLQLPEFTAEAHYRLVIQTANATSFKISAIPQAAQAQHDSRCGNLMLDSRGEKQITGDGSLNACW